MVDVLLVVVVFAAVVVSLVIGYLVGKALTAKLKELEFRERENVKELEYREREKDARRESVNGSRATLRGQFLERLAPHFPDFPHDPTEIRFIGTPVDYVVFRGISNGNVEKVIFLEVKSGHAGLTPGEDDLLDAKLW